MRMATALAISTFTITSRWRVHIMRPTASELTMSIPFSAEGAAGTFRPDLFAGQTVFITGGTSGIGAATAQYFHMLGANVVAAGLAAIAAPIEQSERLKIIELDVTDRTELEGAIKALPQLDHLILCAGISLNSDELEIDSFRRVLEVNLVSGMTAAMAAAPRLIRQGGSIVTVASMYAYFGASERPAYAASKGGVIQLTKSLAQLFAKDGVRVNSVAPGWIETPLAKNLDTKTKGVIMQRIPAARWGASEEVAAVIAFLCSPAASYLTGATLPVDGGYLTS
ncbi:MAG: SDR family oxidoreductase [Sphingobium sp.]